jgi:hypothetical protein
MSKKKKFNSLRFNPSGFVNVCVEVYRASVFVSVNQSDEELRESFAEYEIGPKHLDNILERTENDGFTMGMCLYHEKAGVIFIRIFNPISTPDDIATLAHEALHATIRLLGTKRMKLKRSTEESFTYVMDYIIGSTLEQLTHQPCSKESLPTTTTPEAGPTPNSKTAKRSAHFWPAISKSPASTASTNAR